jgi:hypothetical protein
MPIDLFLRNAGAHYLASMDGWIVECAGHHDVPSCRPESTEVQSGQYRTVVIEDCWLCLCGREILVKENPS